MSAYSNHPVSQAIINAEVQQDSNNEIYTQLADAFKQRPSLNRYARDDSGMLPIHYAAAHYNLSAMQWLCNPAMHPRHQADVNNPIANTDTALSLAVQFQNPDTENQHLHHQVACIDFLLAKGADLKALNYLPLRMAAKKGNLVFLQKSLQTLWPGTKKIPEEFAYKLLEEAASGAQQNVFTYLVGLYQEKKCLPYLSTILYLLQKNNLIELLTLGALAGVTFEEDYLAQAVTRYSLPVIKKLIESHKIRVTLRILLLAATREPEIFAFVLSYFPPNQIDCKYLRSEYNYFGRYLKHSALTTAIQAGRLTNVKTLLKQGAFLPENRPENGSLELDNFFYAYGIIKETKTLTPADILKFNACLKQLTAEDLQDLVFLLSPNPRSLDYMKNLKDFKSFFQEASPKESPFPHTLEQGESSAPPPYAPIASSSSAAPHVAFFTGNAAPQKPREFFEHLLQLSTAQNPLDNNPALRATIKAYAEEELANLSEDREAEVSP